MRIQFLFFILIFMLSGCGFRPLYGISDQLLDQTASIQVQPVAGEGGYQMTLILNEKLNPNKLNKPEAYRLTVILGQPTYVNQSIRSDNFASLESMQMSASYQLIDLKDKKVLVSSSVNSNGLFNLIKDPYATVVAKDKLYANLIQLMAEDISTHILAYFKGKES